MPYSKRIETNILARASVATATQDRQGNTVYNTSTISTDIDAGEGQKIVVGKSSINSTGDALILVIVPKLVQ